jgi:hypothetical protein
MRKSVCAVLFVMVTKPDCDCCFAFTFPYYIDHNRPLGLILDRKRKIVLLYPVYKLSLLGN